MIYLHKKGVIYEQKILRSQRRGKEQKGAYGVNTLLTRKEAAARLGITVMTLDAERSSGHLAYIQRKPGGKVWITEEAIAEYLARATHPVRPELRRVKSLATRA